MGRGGAFLKVLGSLGLALLCALGAFGAHWLIGPSASLSRDMPLPISLVLGAIPLLSWAGLIAAGAFGVMYLLSFSRQMGDFFRTVVTVGERKRRRKVFWQAYREALRYIRLRQLFYQHLMGQENHTLQEIQRTVQKMAAPYINQFKW